MDITAQNQGTPRQRMELGVLGKPECCGAEGWRTQLVGAAELPRKLADKEMRCERMRPHSTAKVWKGWDLHRVCEEEPI